MQVYILDDICGNFSHPDSLDFVASLGVVLEQSLVEY